MIGENGAVRLAGKRFTTAPIRKSDQDYTIWKCRGIPAHLQFLSAVRGDLSIKKRRRLSAAAPPEEQKRLRVSVAA